MRLSHSACCAIVALTAVLASPLSAQPAEPAPVAIAAAKELLAAVGSAKQFDTVMPLIMNQTRTLLLQGRPQIAGEIDKIIPLLMERFAARKTELFDELAIAYARKVPLEDLKAVTAFFVSEPGKRFVALQPELTQESMRIGQRWGEQLGRQIDVEMRQELKKRGIEL
jgi:hypothetical protein